MGGNPAFWKAVKAARQFYDSASGLSRCQWLQSQITFTQVVCIVDVSVIMRTILPLNPKLAVDLFEGTRDNVTKSLRLLSAKVKDYVEQFIPKEYSIVYVLEKPGVGFSKISSRQRASRRASQINNGIRKVYLSSGDSKKKQGRRLIAKNLCLSQEMIMGLASYLDGYLTDIYESDSLIIALAKSYKEAGYCTVAVTSDADLIALSAQNTVDLLLTPQKKFFSILKKEDVLEKLQCNQFVLTCTYLLSGCDNHKQVAFRKGFRYWLKELNKKTITSMEDLNDIFPNYSPEVDHVLREFNMDLPEIVLCHLGLSFSDCFEISLKDRFVGAIKEDGSFLRPGLRLKLLSQYEGAPLLNGQRTSGIEIRLSSNSIRRKQRKAIAEHRAINSISFKSSITDAGNQFVRKAVDRPAAVATSATPKVQLCVRKPNETKQEDHRHLAMFQSLSLRYGDWNHLLRTELRQLHDIASLRTQNASESTSFNFAIYVEKYFQFYRSILNESRMQFHSLLLADISGLASWKHFSQMLQRVVEGVVNSLMGDLKKYCMDSLF
ncbi:hypothetical protein MP638_006045, partial [Amoeboaphelidium occidentale]